jgi:hypothetical protein
MDGGSTKMWRSRPSTIAGRTGGPRPGLASRAIAARARGLAAVAGAGAAGAGRRFRAWLRSSLTDRKTP